MCRETEVALDRIEEQRLRAEGYTGRNKIDRTTAYQLVGVGCSYTDESYEYIDIDQYI